MTMYQPQQHDDDPGHTERVEGDRDVAPAEEAERLEEQHEEPDHTERVENETDGAAAHERDHPEDVGEDEEDRAAAHERDHPEDVGEDEEDRAAAHERDHPKDVADERDGDAAREAERLPAASTAVRGGECAQPALMSGEQLTVLEHRDTGPSHTPARTPTSAHGDFQVFGPGELEGYRSRWESIQLSFVDDPKGAATEADTVVGELLGRLTERRQALRDELNRKPEQDVDTESMRLAVRNYRALFRRLGGS
jgi:hypothetical protein